MHYLRAATLLILLALLALPTTCGCHRVLQRGKSPLSPAQMHRDSVVLEMFFVRFPFGEEKINVDLWREVDEQQFGAELRQKLARNGIRAGVVSGAIPVALSELMELNDKPAANGGEQATKISELAEEPKVLRRNMQTRNGQRGEIVASGVYDELPLLLCCPDGLCGTTFRKAQGILAVRAYPQGDGNVRVNLAPEVHHGAPQQRWVGDQGVMRLEAGRPREVIDDLVMNVELAPGSMLLLSSLPNRPGSLGHYFFTTGKGASEQKLLVIRLAQTQYDDLFVPSEPLSLDESP